MASQHFFKPLLPGFHTHLMIPKAFFLKHIKGRYEQKTVKLRSDASKLTWRVKIDGRRLTYGWEEFGVAHDLKIGDIIVFKHEKDLCFHVTPFGPSCCEIQYTKNHLGKKKPRRETDSSLDHSYFVAKITRSSLRYDMLYLPQGFVRGNGINKKRFKEIVLMSQKSSKTWSFALRQKTLCRTFYIRRGWRSFCSFNGLKVEDSFTFKLTKRGTTLVLRPSETRQEEDDTESTVSLSTESGSDEERIISRESLGSHEERIFSRESLGSDEERISRESLGRKVNMGRVKWRASSSPAQNRFLTLNLRPLYVKRNFLALPIRFARANDIKEGNNMSLLDKHGVKWSTDLRSEAKGPRLRLVGGWKGFCQSNGVKTGESFKLELVWEGNTTAVLRFCSKVKL